MEATHLIELQPNNTSEPQSFEKPPPDHPLTDVLQSLENGEFGPFILSLLHDYISPDFQTEEGYNILHQVAAFNAKEILYLLVEKMHLPVDFFSKTKQTPLMIASNFGFLEIIKYLIDHGASLSATDECNFSSMLYAAKQGELTSLLYLLHRGSDILIKDNNGCNIVHWAAFKNNLFMLRLFKRLNLPLNEMDFHGYRPIDRAISNSGFECVKFFLENIQEEINVASLNFLEIKNEEIKEFLLEKIHSGKRRREKIKRILGKLRKILVFGGYVIWMVLMFLNFSNEEKYIDNFYSIVVILGLWVYLIFYIFIMLKNEKDENKTENNNSRNLDFLIGSDHFFDTLQKIKKKDMELNSFYHLDNLLFNEKDVQNINKYTILHYIAYLIENYHFLDILDIDYHRVCPSCLIYKPPKTKHCSICNKCVGFYHHHSLIFNRCFSSKNHIFYVGLLILQAIITSLFLKVMLFAFYNDCQSICLFFIPEIFYIICKEKGLIWGLNFIANLVIWCYNSLFLAIELYGIIKNLTFNEMMNRHRYRYLFKSEKTKKGKIVYVFGKNNKGMFANIKNYILRYFNS